MAVKLWLATMAGFVLCLSAPREGLAQATRDLESPAFVLVAGGRGSCPWVSHPGESPLWDELEKRLPLQRQVIIARSCFHFSNSRVISWDVKKVDPYGRSETLLGWEWGTLGELKASVRPWWKESDELTFVGQSYGGYVAHWLAHHMAPIDQADTVLFTIDPISPRQCGVSHFLTDSRYCQGFPSDMERLSSDTVFEGTWLNFYQKDFALLHSGATSFATRNVKLDYEGFSWRLMGAHKLTESDPRVWAKIMEAL